MTAYWIQTNAGIAFDLAYPKPEMIHTGDIANGLAQINRYTGQARFPMSVAQHSILMAQQVEPEHALWALLHDAHEAYTGDISSPVKRMLRDSLATPSALDDLQESVDAAICSALKYEPSHDSVHAVRVADARMLVTEKAQLLGEPPQAWGIDAEPYDIKIAQWTWQAAKETYRELLGDLLVAHRSGEHA